MQQAVEVFITGNVQGVGFRKFIKQNALTLQLSGWTRNMVHPTEKEGSTERGGVEALFCGEPEAIEQIISLCRKGPMLAIVKDVKVTTRDTKEEFSGFEIVI